MHEALWVGGPDENRLRWLRDGWVRTPLSAARRHQWQEDGLGLAPAQAVFSWTHVRAVDARGRAYIVAASSKTGVWRACDRRGDR